MPILTSGGTVKVYDRLDIVLLRPSDSLEEVVVLPLDIWFVGSDIVCPISYRDAHVIESRKRRKAQYHIPCSEHVICRT
jgi:hypothetical protein